MSRHTTEAASASTFDDWARRGRGESMATEHGPLLDAILDRWTLGPDDRVLDVGCGVGAALQACLDRGAGGVVGVDVSPEMVARAQARLAPRGGEAHQASGHDLPFEDDRFTHALSIESLYYHHDPVRSLAEVGRVLAPGGHLDVVIELYADNPGAHGWVEALGIPMVVWSAARWIEALHAAGFEGTGQARVVRDVAPEPEADFTPSAYFRTYADLCTYLAEGALHLWGRVPTGPGPR